MICLECGVEFASEGHKPWLGHFCSNKCQTIWKMNNYEPNCKCAMCGKSIYHKPSTIKRNKNGVTCSLECARKLRAIYSSGKNNHQYGLTGDKNASFKSSIRTTNYGYIIECAPNHPFPHDSSNKCERVFQHRLVVEQYHHMFDDKFFIIINGKHYLKPEYEVHHINHNKKDNRVENLQVMTKSEHRSLHNSQNTIIRDSSTGRIIGVIKSGKNGETCDGNTVLTNRIADRAIGSVEHRS